MWTGQWATSSVKEFTKKEKDISRRSSSDIVLPHPAARQSGRWVWWIDGWRSGSATDDDWQSGL